MKIILKDGIKYLSYKYKNEEELEKMIIEHYKEIFGGDSIFLSKHKIRTSAGLGTIPDAFVLSLGEKRWYVIEVELSDHPLYQHIVPQITKFYNALKNTTTQKELVRYFYNEVKADPWKFALFQSNGISEVYKFISETIETKPEIVIIVNEENSELNDVCDALPFNSKVIVFKTYCRENVGIGVHIHLFESVQLIEEEGSKPIMAPIKSYRSSVRVIDLIKAGIIKPGDKIYRVYKGKRYGAEILVDGRIKLEDGTIVDSPSNAAGHISKKSENGWRIWRYKDENGREYLMDELRKRIQ